MPQNKESGIPYEETMQEITAAYNEPTVAAVPALEVIKQPLTPEQKVQFMSEYTKDLEHLRARALDGLVGREDTELVA